MNADGTFDPLFDSGMSGSNKAAVVLTEQNVWNSEDNVFMSILPVQRKDVV